MRARAESAFADSPIWLTAGLTLQCGRSSLKSWGRKLETPRLAVSSPLSFISSRIRQNSTSLPLGGTKGLWMRMRLGWRPRRSIESRTFWRRSSSATPLAFGSPPSVEILVVR